MNFIAIDLELEQPNTNSQTPDSAIDHEQILSLGVCVGDELGNVIHQENIFYRYEHPISKFIKDLTGIREEQVANGCLPLDAVQKLEEIRTKYDASRVLLEWGSGDYSCLMKEAGLSTQNAIFGRSGLNVKHLYRTWCVAHQMSPSGGLKTSINKFTKNSTDPDNKFFKFLGTPHNSQVDAGNTFHFYIRLMKTMI